MRPRPLLLAAGAAAVLGLASLGATASEPQAATVELSATNVRTTEGNWHEYHHTDAPCPVIGHINHATIPAGTFTRFVVGYRNHISHGCYAGVAVFRGAVRYDLGALAHRHVVAAKIVLAPVAGWLDGGNQEQSALIGCTDSVGYATDRAWMNASYHPASGRWPGLQPYTEVMVRHAAHGAATIDMTSMVRAWVAGTRPNDGVVFDGQGFDRNGSVSYRDAKNLECVSVYATPKLSITYQH